MTTAVPFEDLTDELYANPPERFVARRDELARDARAAGERDLAGRITGLRRPTVGAWYLNAAARSGLTSLRELLHLGEDLRAAQARGDVTALRELAARRKPLVSRVVSDLGAHLATRLASTSVAGLDEVRVTLAAALADPEVAELVARGRMDGPRVYAGFGEAAFPVPPGREPVAGDPAETGPARPAPPAPPASKADREQERRRARAAAAELARAEAALAAAREQRTIAATDVRRERAEVGALRARLAAREADLARAEERLAAAGRAEAEAVTRRDAARRRGSAEPA